MPSETRSSSNGKYIAIALVAIVAIYGAKQGWFNNLAPQFNLSNNLPGSNYGYSTYQMVTQTQQQYITQTPATPLGSSGASCQIALARTSINVGDNLAGQLTSNRPGTQVNIYHRLMGEAINPNIITGVTDAQGSWLAFSGQINIPGIYQIAATLDFVSERVEIACTPVVTVTVHSNPLIDVQPTSQMIGLPLTFNVYSDQPNLFIEIQYSNDGGMNWNRQTSQQTNQGGHYVYNLPNACPSVGPYLFRTFDPVEGFSTNQAQVNCHP